MRLRFQQLFTADDVERAFVSDSEPTFLGQAPKRGKRAEGIRYERKAQDRFEALYEGHYLRSPWLCFFLRDNPRMQWCQPDGLLFDFAAGKLTIVEFKLRHCSEAWYQLNQLYLPVVQKLFPQNFWDAATLEVCRWYDCAVATPQPVTLRENPLDARPGDFSVHIWRP